MGYYADFSLDSYHEDVVIPEDVSGWCDQDFFDSKEVNGYKWYDHIKDMLKVSLVNPDVEFRTSGVGEENGDQWQCVFLNNKDLYINKKTFKCLEGYIPKGIDWIKIPEEAEECYYFDGSDPEGVEDLCFYAKDLEATWSDSYWSDNVKSDSPTYQEIKNYIREYGKLVWKRNVTQGMDNTIDTVNSVTDSVNHPKHYTSDDCGVEAIEVTSLLPACISNAVKYVWRCGKKDEDLQELKKALWYINYSIDNDLPSFVDELSDSLEFQELVEKVKSHWVGNKYMFIDAVYWGNQETIKKALELMIQELTSNQET